MQFFAVVGLLFCCVSGASLLVALCWLCLRYLWWFKQEAHANVNMYEAITEWKERHPDKASAYDKSE